MSTTTTAAQQRADTAPVPYVERAIDVAITLGKGTFGQSGSNTVKLSGLRVVATIDKAGMPSFDKAEIRIYGAVPSLMNQLSTLGVPLPMLRQNNSVLVTAGDAKHGMKTAFEGAIGNAWVDFDAAPETFLQIIAWTGRDNAMKPVPPISFPGTGDVATIMSGLAQTMGYAFENDGVEVKISNPYLPGTAMEQAHSLARAADIEMYIDSGTSPPTLAIWPKTKTRAGTIPLISPERGLIGYPKYRDQGMSFRCLFTPTLKLGGQIQMQSSLQPACGYWCIIGLNFNLASQLANGPWFCEVNCARTFVPSA